MALAKFKYRDSSGGIKEGFFTLEDYQLASQKNMRAAAVVNARHSDADPQFGSAFEQGCRYLGIFPKGDVQYGIMPTTVREMLDGSCSQKLAGVQLAGGSIVSPQAPIGNSTPASRVFFPEVVMAFMQENLSSEFGTEESAFASMFALNQSITSEVFTQPMINTSAPGAQDMAPIGQNQLPANMVSITASQTSQAMGAISIGLQISDQAARDATLDLITIILNEQTAGQRKRMLWRDLGRVITGNPDANEAAISATPFWTFDEAAPAAAVTHDGYMRMLWEPEGIYNWDKMYGPLKSFLAIERRQGRPLAYDPNLMPEEGVYANRGNEGTYGINPGNPRIINYASSQPDWLMIPDNILGANQFVLLDSRYALAQVTNVAANYSAVEQMVLQRTTVFRFDMSQFRYRLRASAIKLIDFTSAKPD